jgi:hypothetical protein
MPVKVNALAGVVAISSFGWHSLALKTDGTVWAWGNNGQGRLGNGTDISSNLPVQVTGLSDGAAVAAGLAGSLALRRDGTLWSWGSGFNGELGNGTNGDSRVPVAVAGLSGVGVIAGAASHRLAATGSPPPTVKVVSANGGEKVYTGSPFRIEWTAASAVALSSFDVSFSRDSGLNFIHVSGCTALPGTARSCTWASPGPVTSQGRFMVEARNLVGQPGFDTSDANFSIVGGTAAIAVTAPNTSVNWGIGSTQQIRWNHNLGLGSRVNIEISRDGGSTWSTLASRIPNSAAASGFYNWTVNGPPTATRSDVNFTVAPANLTLTAPNTAGARWGIGTQRIVTWTSNFSPAENVRILLSTNGGMTFPVTLAASTPNDNSHIVSNARVVVEAGEQSGGW